jgi:hypothetical protein
MHLVIYYKHIYHISCHGTISDFTMRVFNALSLLPSNSSGMRSEQGEALLSVLTEFWLNVNSYPNHEMPEELIVPCVTHLVSVRRLLAYLLSDTTLITHSQQTTVAAAGALLPTAHTNTLGVPQSQSIPLALTNDIAKLQRNLFHFIRTSLLCWPQTWNESFSQVRTRTGHTAILSSRVTTQLT